MRFHHREVGIRHRFAPVFDRVNGHLGGVNGLAFDAEGKRLFTASSDCSLLAWDLAEVERLYREEQARREEEERKRDEKNKKKKKKKDNPKPPQGGEDEEPL